MRIARRNGRRAGAGLAEEVECAGAPWFGSTFSTARSLRESLPLSSLGVDGHREDAVASGK